MAGEGFVAVYLRRAVLFGTGADAADGGEGGLLSGLGDADVERAFQVGAAGEDGVACLFVLRGAFATEHAFVHAAGARFDASVHGDGMRRQDADVVIHADGGQRHEAVFAVGCALVDGVRQEAGKVVLVVAGAAAGVRFEGTADGDEEDEHGDAVVVDFAVTEDGVVEAGEPCARAGDGDGHVHVEAALFEGEPGVFQEGVAGVEHDRGAGECADPAQQLFVFALDAEPGAGVEAGREHHHLHHAEAGNDEAQQVVVAAAMVAALFLVRCGEVRGVAEVGDGGEDGRERGVTPADFGAACRQVDVGVGDAVRAFESAADEPGTGGAVQAVDVEVDFVIFAVVIGVLGGDVGQVVGLPVAVIVGGIRSRCGAVAHGVVLVEVVRADDGGDGTAGGAAVSMAGVVMDVGAGKDGLLAVVAGHGGVGLWSFLPDATRFRQAA